MAVLWVEQEHSQQTSIQTTSTLSDPSVEGVERNTQRSWSNLLLPTSNRMVSCSLQRLVQHQTHGHNQPAPLQTWPRQRATCTYASVGWRRTTSSTQKHLKRSSRDWNRLRRSPIQVDSRNNVTVQTILHQRKILCLEKIQVHLC